MASYLFAGAALADPAAQGCVDAEVARFERDLSRARSGAYEGLAEIVDAREIEVCGVTAILRCEAGEDVIPCLEGLTAAQDAMRAKILASLPEAVPDAPLYAKLSALAAGSSAGADCAGMEGAVEAWCEAREAARRVEIAVDAYEAARAAGAMEPAYALGWARALGPVRPRQRPEDRPWVVSPLWHVPRTGRARPSPREGAVVMTGIERAAFMLWGVAL